MNAAAMNAAMVDAASERVDAAAVAAAENRRQCRMQRRIIWSRDLQ